MLARARQLDADAAAAAVAGADAMQAARALAAPSEPQLLLEMIEQDRAAMRQNGHAEPLQNGHQPPDLVHPQNGGQHAEQGGEEDEDEDCVYGGIFEGRCSRMQLGSARTSHTGSHKGRSVQDGPEPGADSNV